MSGIGVWIINKISNSDTAAHEQAVEKMGKNGW